VPPGAVGGGAGRGRARGGGGGGPGGGARRPPPLEDWAETVSGRLRFVPCWDAWTLRQLSPDGYTLAKRTDAEHPWITAPGGTRSRGYAYVGDTGGGIG